MDFNTEIFHQKFLEILEQLVLRSPQATTWCKIIGKIISFSGVRNVVLFSNIYVNHRVKFKFRINSDVKTRSSHSQSLTVTSLEISEIAHKKNNGKLTALVNNTKVAEQIVFEQLVMLLKLFLKSYKIFLQFLKLLKVIY